MYVNLIPSPNRPHVLVIPSSRLTPMDITFSSNSTLMVLDPLLANIHQFYSHSSSVTKTIYSKGKLIHNGISDHLDPLNTWTKTIGPDQGPAYNKPTISTKKGISTIIINDFIPHSTLPSATEDFLNDGASFIEFRFSNIIALKPTIQTSLLFPFP